MSETLLDIVKAACGELVLPVPSSVIGSTDDYAVSMLAMLYAAGRDLVRRYEWGALVNLTTLPTVANVSDYPLPADYHRMVNDTQWDRSTRWRVHGPLTPQADRYLRESQIAPAVVYRDFRLIGTTSIRLTPTPPDASGVIAFEYVSKAWIVSGAVKVQAFATDADTTLFPFDLLVKDCKWRWLRAKGLDAASYKAERDDALMECMAADQGGPTLRMGGPNDHEDGGFVVANPNFVTPGN